MSQEELQKAEGALAEMFTFMDMGDGGEGRLEAEQQAEERRNR